MQDDQNKKPLSPRKLQKNVGKLDKLLRGAAGVAILSLVFLGPQTSWGYLGLIALVSAASGFCPLYTAFGVRTCPRKESETR